MHATERPHHIPSDGLVLFVVKGPDLRFTQIAQSNQEANLTGTKTSTHNTVKPLILIEELSIPHDIYVVPSVSSAWFADINPHKMVPAIEDQLPDSKGTISVWESSSTLTYLADAYDKHGLWRGRDLGERTEIGNWLTLHTAALGPTAKYWLYFQALHKEKIPAVIEKLAENVAKQYDILERRLSTPGYLYIALPNRPTIADIATLPFGMESTATLIGHEFG
ncbi:MAG: hypothetical protein M1830_006233, partial [Pleopsidium flavum]